MTSRKQLCALIILAIKTKNRKKILSEKWFQKRATLSHMALIAELRLSVSEDLKNYLRMSKESFQLLLNLVKPLFTKQNTRMRSAISAEEKLIATLRFLATLHIFPGIVPKNQTRRKFSVSIIN